MLNNHKRYCDRCGVELTKKNNKCGYELCDKCNDSLEQDLKNKIKIEVKPKEYKDGSDCPFDKGKVVQEWETGDTECDAYSQEYECGGIYHHNYMDVIGCRDHDCFWICCNCKRVKGN